MDVLVEKVTVEGMAVLHSAGGSCGVAELAGWRMAARSWKDEGTLQGAGPECSADNKKKKCEY